VRVEADDAMSAAFPREWPCAIRVKLRDGRHFDRHVPYPKGEPEAPMSHREIEAKFRDLASVAITGPSTDKVIAAVWALDKEAGLSPLMAAIAGGLRK
jgi:2-methylcitrate dehydratase PrpD